MLFKRRSQRSPAATQAPKTGLALFLTVFPSIMLPMFLAIVDQTIVAAALPAIAGELGHVDRVSWTVVSYLVAATIAAPVYGRLGDLMGRRRLMFVALVVFMTGSLLCALAPSLELLVAARILQGFGGGGLMTLSQALIGEAIPPRDRARYQGYIAAVAVSSNAFGPVAGGFLTEHFGWRSIFLINLPIGVVSMALALRLPARRGSGQAFRFDALGLLLFASFIASALVLVQQLQRFDTIDIPAALALAGIVLASIVLLVWREKRAPDPLLPLPLIRNPSIWRADALAACHGAMLVSLMAFLPIYLRVTYGASPAEIGVLLLPMTVGIGLGSIITGRLVSRTGRTAVFPSWGLVIVLAAMVFLAIYAPVLSARQLSWFLGAIALFMGSVMGVVQVTVQTAAGSKMLGTAAATVQLSRSLGAALGTATVGAVLFATMTLKDPEAAGLFASILQQPDVLASLPEARQAVIRSDIADAFQAAFFTIAAFAAAAAVLAWTIPLRRI